MPAGKVTASQQPLPQSKSLAHEQVPGYAGWSKEQIYELGSILLRLFRHCLANSAANANIFILLGGSTCLIDDILPATGVAMLADDASLMDDDSPLYA
ncbi:unnamed protein product [Protopolystoma xenopodis]|uniref:Uncharacterized protein n=1 Tax=Protopolystoma xenopodis TaxID=117903 RepID=A0A3S5FDD6_9PLAT|nr:unnamed protein product [Protopolystoma xenopodis]